jgi:hypothetical protein
MSETFHLMAGDPYAAKAKTNKTKGPKAMTTKQQVKAAKSRTIDDMSTAAIVWHVVYRHRVALLIAALALSWAFFIVTGLPAAVQNIRG